jgi:hypothetical protein
MGVAADGCVVHKSMHCEPIWCHSHPGVWLQIKRAVHKSMRCVCAWCLSVSTAGGLQGLHVCMRACSLPAAHSNTRAADALLASYRYTFIAEGTHVVPSFRNGVGPKACIGGQD